MVLLKKNGNFYAIGDTLTGCTTLFPMQNYFKMTQKWFAVRF